MNIATMVADTAFEDSKREVYKIVHKFCDRYKLPYEEAMSAAGLAFTRAVLSYDADKAEFSTWVWHKVWNGLLVALKAEIRRNSRPIDRGVDVDAVAPRPGFTLVEFLEGLSDDARTVVMLVFDPPINVRVTVGQLGADTPAAFRQAAREFLADCGWDKKRVTDTFREIKEAL